MESREVVSWLSGSLQRVSGEGYRDRFCHQCLWDSASSSVNCHQLEEAVNWCTYVSVK